MHACEDACEGNTLTMDPLARAESLYRSALDAYERGDAKIMQHYATMLLGAAEPIDNKSMLARGHNLLGGAYAMQNNADLAEQEYRSALDLYRTAGEPRGVASSLTGLGSVYSEMYLDYAVARAFFEQALTVALEAGAEVQVAFALVNLGEVSSFESDYGRALSYSAEALAIFERLDDVYVASELIRTALYHALRADYVQAVEALHNAFTKLRRDQRKTDVAHYFEVWFFIAIEVGRYEEAARLLGFLETYRTENNVPRLPSMMPWFAPRLEKLEERLGYDAMMRYRRDGEFLSFNECNAITVNILERAPGNTHR